jgi:voltage-gated potassium channel
MRNHTVVVGFGTKGRAATTALLADGVPPSQIVVVDSDAGCPRQRLVTGSGDGAGEGDVLG